LKEFAQGYFEAEKMKKEQELRQYKEAYNNLENKDSFDAEYLESIIYNLEH